MSDISNIASIHPLTIPLVTDTTGYTTETDRRVQSFRDSVEISPRASALARVAEESSLSLARTRAIRAEIENGTFETPERIEGTVKHLLDVIG